MATKEDIRERRADIEAAAGRFKEFSNINDLISDLRDPGTMRPCNNPSCTTCLCDCWWRSYGN